MSSSGWSKRSFLDLSGTADRRRVLFLCLAVFIAAAGIGYLTITHSRLTRFAIPPFVGLAILLDIAMVQRLHALGRTGYWKLVGVIPYISAILLIAVLILPAPSGTNSRRVAHPVAQLIYGLVLCVLFALSFLRLIYQPYWIPSEAMKSTLLVGDYVVVSMLPFTPQRGDVVVFRHPVNGEDYIKRLIGLPGDKIQMKDGLLYVNGTVAPQEPAGVFKETFEAQGSMANSPRCSNTPVGEGGICEKQRFIETLPSDTKPGGIKHDVLNIDTNGYADNTDVFTVPVGNYFFMGDNRDNSMDSRFSQSVGGVGYVPAEYLIGRADRIMFSSAGSSLFQFWTWRSDRYFKAVN